MRFVALLSVIGSLLLSPTFCAAEEIVAESTLLSVLHEAEIPAQDVGILEELKVQEGAQVEKDQLLGHLNQAEAKLQKQLASKQLEVAREEAENDISQAIAKKTIEVAKAEFRRAEEANKKYSDTVSQTEVDRLRLVAEKAELDYQQSLHEKRVRQLNADLRSIEEEIASANLARRSIKSPLNGVVERIDVRPGEWVEPGTTLMRVIQRTKLRAEAILPAEYRHHELMGSRVSVSLPERENNGEAVFGRIRFVHPESDPIDGSFRVWAEMENEDLLLHPGESVTMTIHPDDRKPNENSPGEAKE